MDDTIYLESNIGKRINDFQQAQECSIMYKGNRVPIVGKITIGRDKSNDIVLNNLLISRNHAEIQKIKDDYYIHDLNSSNGTFVNDVLVPKDKYVKINPSDEVRVGKTKLNINN